MAEREPEARWRAHLVSAEHGRPSAMQREGIVRGHLLLYPDALVFAADVREDRMRGRPVVKVIPAADIFARCGARPRARGRRLEGRPDLPSRVMPRLRVETSEGPVVFEAARRRRRVASSSPATTRGPSADAHDDSGCGAAAGPSGRALDTWELAAIGPRWAPAPGEQELTPVAGGSSPSRRRPRVPRARRADTTTGRGSSRSSPRATSRRPGRCRRVEGDALADGGELDARLAAAPALSRLRRRDAERAVAVRRARGQVRAARSPPATGRR